MIQQARADVDRAVMRLASVMSGRADLEDEITMLRERIKQLTALLVYDGAMRTLPISAKEEIVLRLLYKRPVATHEQIHEMLYGGTPDCERPASANIVSVYVYNLRHKLPITIENVRGCGYRLPSASRSWIKDQLLEESA
jgi:DNA-binding response OmpR family regulator